MDNLELKLSIYDKEQYDKIYKFLKKIFLQELL